MKVDQQPQLAFYTEPGRMTTAGCYTALLKDLPQGFASLATVAHGLLIHEHMAHGYGVKLSDVDRASVHIRPVEQILEQIMARDSRPLDMPRTPERSKQAQAISMNSLAGILVQRNTEYCIAQTKIVN